MPPLPSFLPLIAAFALACAAYLAFRLAAGIRKHKTTLGAYRQAPQPGGEAQHVAATLATPEIPMGSPAYKIRLAFSSKYLDVAGWEKTARWVAIGVLAAAVAVPILILGLPLTLLAAAPIVAYVVVSTYIENQWATVRLSMEKEIPTLLGRLASFNKVNPDVAQSLDLVGRTLDPANPLRPWVSRLAEQVNRKSPEGIAALQSEAALISPAILLTVVEVARMAETGGEGYAEALRAAAANTGELIQAKVKAGAVAAGAWGTIRTIILALGVTLGSVLVNPVSKPAFTTPVMQIAILACFAWAAFGFWQIRDAVADVTE